MKTLMTILLCAYMLQSTRSTHTRFLPSAITCPQQLVGVGCECHTISDMSIFCKDLDLESWPRFSELPTMDLDILDLSGNSFDHIPPNVFGNLRIRHLVMSNNENVFGNGIDDPGDIQNVFNHHQESSLLSLDVSNNNIHIFPAFLNELTDLKSLNLIGNTIDHIPSSAMTSSSHLQELRLGQISEIQSPFFQSFPNLKVLELGPYRPYSFPFILDFLGHQNVNHLQNLETLIIKDAFTLLNVDLLVKFPKLTHLEVVRCRVGDLQLTIMQGPEGGSRLRHLALSHNDISFMPEYFLALSLQLETLDLSHNSISVIHGRYQDSNPMLAYVDLSHNNIYHLQANAFSGLTQLHVLDLRDNALQYLPEAAIPQHSADLVLHLSSNDLRCDCDNEWLVRLSYEQHLGLAGPLDIYEVEHSFYCYRQGRLLMYQLYDIVAESCHNTMKI